MSTPTFEEVFQAAQQLPIADQQLLVELLKPPKTIEQLAEEQGVGPFDFEAARAEATFWPEDENVDDFIVIESSHALCRKWAEVSEQVKRAGRVIHPNDAWIAATALLYGVELVTHNASGFDYLPELTIITEA